ncbi:MAG: D-glycero-beta-D-manno-heptose 1,7-bisphosphate 7-phosphatase [Gammaproteobacteria bacterium]
MRLLILDRDGVINEESAEFIKTPDEWHAIPGSLDAIARASRAGCRVVVASNQSGIGRGLYNMDALNQIHQKMLRELAAVGGAIEAIFFCPHTPEDDCHCRKPRPGLYEDIGRRLRTSLEGVPVVVDRISDIKAAQAVGARPFLVLTGHGKDTLKEARGLYSGPAYADLGAVVEKLFTTGWLD